MPADTPRRSARQIEEAIDSTRAEIGHTLDALADKLTVRQLMDKGIDMVSHSFDSRGAGRPGPDGLRIGPIPLALIGLGIAWLVASNTGVAQKMAEDERIRALPRRLANLTGRDDGASPNEPAEDGGEKRVTGLGDDSAIARTDGVEDGWVHQATGAAKGAARTALGSVCERGAAVLDRAGTYAGSAGERASDFGERVTQVFRRYPLLFGAAGIAVGAALARLLPATRDEEAWLGGAREAVWEKAEDLGREAADRLRHAVAPEADAAAKSGNGR